MWLQNIANENNIVQNRDTLMWVVYACVVAHMSSLKQQDAPLRKVKCIHMSENLQANSLNRV